jgi:molybdate/tungstate transport system ATP-binding protein
VGLVVDGVSKRWQGFELKNITFTVEDNDHFVLLGPTGAGKTLLLETIMGFHRPDSGRIILDDQDINNTLPEQRNLGYVSQKCVLFPHLNVRQNVEFGLKMRGTQKTERAKLVNQVLELTGLKPLEQRRPSTLSGGEKQKVALARVLALNPKTILFDEPLTGIDAEAAWELKRELKRISRNGKNIIHVTHNQIEAFSLGSKLAIMQSGEIVQTGKPKDVFTRPKTRFVAKFLGYENVFEVQPAEKPDSFSVVTVGGVRLKVSKTPNSSCVVAIRPEDISVHFSSTKSSADNLMSGTVAEFSDQGPTVSVTVDAELSLHVIMTKRVFVENNLCVGQNVWLSFKRDAIKLIEN